MRIRPLVSLFTTLALAGTGVAAATGAAAPRQVKQPTATGAGGAVASADFDASKAGIAVLRGGGNAVDAAVATAAALGVTEPFVAGPGGGGFMVVYLAREHRVVTIDGREKCPATCTSRQFIDPATGKPLPFEEARRSGLSVGVPGQVKTWSNAVRAYGRKSFGSDLQPAIRVARRGFVIDPNFNEQERIALADLQSFTGSRKLFLTAAGQPLPVGSTLKNPDLARTYQQLAAHGPDYLYRGPLGAAVSEVVQHPPVYPGVATFPIRPGSMTRADLAAYTAPERAPTKVSYRGRDIYSMPPPSSGGITIGEALNILSGYDLSREPRAQALFHYLESSRLSFADRNAYIGDSDYVDVPQHGLLDPAYAATRRCLIGSTALTSPVLPGRPYPPYTGCTSAAKAGTPDNEGMETNHLTVADKWGNVVSYTNTIEQLAGSGITVPHAGFLLNNEMTDFDFAPATPSTYDPNLPAAGKRPRSSMSPTIVLRNGRFDFAVGSPGGATIITTVLQILLNHIDFGMSLPAAIAAPRASQRNSARTDAEPAFSASPVAARLTAQYGETFNTLTGPVLPSQSWIGNATGIQSLGHGRYQAAAEPVRSFGGSALVVDPTG
ncbi:MAG TPA: gamma-glutamyltransferase [Jatrophihabitans sp.]|uniref:gamma-glutamyltransferase n=1 Tax=Jatrophihabitans sp. TaxID=1932789 RepID=UPI002E0948CC|nr:gamma-glutamyltransferase [Jatrophihabitans sp.]